MGKATRWLKGIFGIKSTHNNNNNDNNDELKKCYSGDRKRSGFGSSGVFCNNPATITPNITSPESRWVKSYYGESESEKEQSKHAIAVAAATAAAADAAVAAAQAAVAVVRLTSHGRGKMFPVCGGGGTERWAAVKIQTTFRGYLARKALRALKGLVKIQALVRGYLVRKQATATLHGMQALIRAQATVRSKRANKSRIANYDFYSYPKSDIRARRSLEIFDDTRSEHAASIHSRRLSASFESRSMNPITEDIPKIVEVDLGRPRTPSRQWKNNNFTGPGSDPCDHDPFYPPRISIPSCQHWPESEWGFSGDECRYSSTAHSTPRFMNSGGLNPGLVTPSKSMCGDSSYNYLRQYGNYHQHPNYMSNTQSFRAKVRSQSAPKQRPEEGHSRKRLSLNEMMESRNSLSSVRMQRSRSQAQESVNFKNAVMSKLERSCDFGRESYHLQRK